MMFHFLAALLLSQVTSAGDILKQIEDKLNNAHTLQFEVTERIEEDVSIFFPDSGESETKRDSYIKEGKVVVADVRCSISSHYRTVDPFAGAFTLVSDSRHLMETWSGPFTPIFTYIRSPANLRNNLMATTARWAPLAGMGFLVRKDGKDPEAFHTRFRLEELRLGQRDGSLETLTYTLNRSNSEYAVKGKVWYDPHTLTLRKKSLDSLANDHWECTVWYRNWLFDAPVVNETFQLPRIREY